MNLCRLPGDDQGLSLLKETSFDIRNVENSSQFTFVFLLQGRVSQCSPDCRGICPIDRGGL